MSEKPRKRLVGRREYVKILGKTTCEWTFAGGPALTMGLLFLWVAREMVSSFRALQSPWYAYAWPVLCVGLSLSLSILSRPFPHKYDGHRCYRSDLHRA